MQLMRAAKYYFQHLDKQVQVVVVSDATANQHTDSSGLPGNLSKPAASQQQATDTALPLAAIETSDDELDKLLQGGPEDFDLGALKPLQSSLHRTQPSQVRSLMCCDLC